MNKLILSSVALAIASAASAHDGHSNDADATLAQVGTEFMVMETSANEAAEASFKRGLALLHNFEYRFSAEEFRHAQEADPDFVMAYWGEAMTYNHPLWEAQDRDAALAVLARLGATPQARAAKARSPREARWLDAVETLYGAGSKVERDFAYLAKMRAIFAADPTDVDARAFTGLAILGSSHGGRQIPIYMQAAGLLEPGFMTHERHPGILHYLIHSYDDPVHAPLGARAAERYATVAPDAGHAQHMVSHIFHALGDWEASERANINADAVVDRQRIAAGREPTSCGHYNEWLAYSLIQQGKNASEIVNGCRAQAMASVAEGSKSRLGSGAASSYGAIAGWNGVVTGVWPEPVDIPGDGFLFLRFDMATASLLKSIGDEAATSAALGEMRELGRDIEQTLATEDSLNTYVMPWLNRQLDQAEAIVALSAGRTDEGLRLLREAAEAEIQLPEVFGPPAIAKPSYELLGEQLLALGQHAEAADAFRKSLAFAPGRKLSLEGLSKVTTMAP